MVWNLDIKINRRLLTPLNKVIRYRYSKKQTVLYLQSCY